MIEITYEILNRMFLMKTDWKPFCKAFDNCLSEFLVEKYMLRNFWSFESGEKIVSIYVDNTRQSLLRFGEKKEKELGGAACLLCSTVPTGWLGTVFN
jgi:hypothetical protein